MVAQQVGQAARSFRRHLRRCRHSCSAEDIHQLRIHARRLLVLIDLLAVWSVKAEIAPARREVKRLLRALARLRDTQVLSAWLTEAPRSVAPVARRFRSRLEAEERRLRKRVFRRCHEVRPRRLAAILTAGAERVRERTRTDAGNAAVRAAVRRWLDRLFARVRARRQQVTKTRPATLHRLRIAVKKFRYAVEPLAPWLDGLPPRSLNRLRQLQSRLGELQDVEVGRLRLREAMVRHPERAADFAKLLDWMDRRWDARLRRLLRTLDGVTSVWPPPSAGLPPRRIRPSLPA